MAPRFAELGHPLPAFRVSIGWPSAGKDAPVTGECWDKRVSKDGHFEIFLNPGRDDGPQVACTLAHELIHAAVGLDQGHKGNFARVALELGFTRPLTHASAEVPEKLAAWVGPIIKEVGALPHGAITYTKTGDVRVKRTGAGVVPLDGGDGDGDGDGGPINTRPPKQSTRLHKVCCADCGYTVRVTQRWIEEGLPHCPNHGEMALAS
ncbi:TPA: transcription elongation protein SprT [Burkholderia vietnamiensis]|nr:transcription elongation protein SprT [Burkholderia vietnamiensis]